MVFLVRSAESLPPMRVAHLPAAGWSRKASPLGRRTPSIAGRNPVAVTVYRRERGREHDGCERLIADLLADRFPEGFSVQKESKAIHFPLLRTFSEHHRNDREQR